MDKIGKYETVRVLGTGATSTVYLATDPFNKQQVAIKLFDLGMLRDPNRAKVYRKLLMTEASLAGKLSHPHIAKILDAVMEGDSNYVVMEYIEGGTLEKYAEVDTLLPIGSIAEIIYKCCKALEYAQYQGVIHRDIKPANIFVAGRVRYQDFRFWCGCNPEPANHAGQRGWFACLHVTGASQRVEADPSDGYLFAGCRDVQAAYRQAAI